MAVGLLEAVRRRPYSVVLFEEAEKAHPAIYDTLLKILEDGHLPDGQGRTINFTNTVIILICKLGAEHLPPGLSEMHSLNAAREKVMQEVKRNFKPELLNRLDEIVIFDPFSRQLLRKVISLHMKDVVGRLEERGVFLDITDAALELLVAESYDPASGAYPSRRCLERKVVTHVSKMVLKDEIGENSTVYIDANGEELSFRGKQIGGNENTDSSFIQSSASKPPSPKPNRHSACSSWGRASIKRLPMAEPNVQLFGRLRHN